MGLRSPSLHLGLFLMFVWLLGDPFVLATEYYVAPSGSDENSGTSEKNPFRTIQKAASVAKAGDKVLIKGGVYRETVIPANSGQKDRPIIFQGKEGEKVIIDGTDPVTGWKPYKDGIEQAPMPGDWFSRATPGDGQNLYDPKVHNQADQVFVDNKMMVLARWPNCTTLDPSFPTKAVCEKFVSKTRDSATNWTTGVMVDRQLDLPPEAVVGAQIYFQPNWDAWSWLFTGYVTAVEKDQFTFRTRSEGGKDHHANEYDKKSRYYFFDKLELLDAPGEWYHDKRAGILYLKSPDGKPLEGRVTAKRREYAFDLTNKSYITIQNLTIHACTITTDRDSGGDNIGYDANGKSRYPWRNPASGVPMEPFHNPSAFKDAPSEGIVIENVEAYYLTHFTDVSGHFFGQWGQSSGIVLSGKQHVIRNCRIRYSAGNGITLVGREHRAMGNVIEDTGYMANDCAAIHTGVTLRCSSDHEIAWNTIRRVGRSAIVPRYLYRSDPADGSDWKARIHHNDISEFGIQDWDIGGIYSVHNGRFLRIDHNFIHDAFENVDSLAGAGAFTASGIYPDYSAQWIIDHNVIWNVEWAIHIQNQEHKGEKGPAGFLVTHNTMAVRMLGGKPSMHGPYGIVKNSPAPLQESLFANNVILLLDQSAKFKPIDFEADPAVNRIVENNVWGKSFEELGLTGGSTFPANLMPKPTASQIVDKGKTWPLGEIAGLRVPSFYRPYQGSAPDLGALEVGEMLAVGYDAWPESPAMLAKKKTEEEARQKAEAALALAKSDARSPTTPSTHPMGEGKETKSNLSLIIGILIAIIAVAVWILIFSGTKKDSQRRRYNSSARRK